jgi:hypothetical protein
MLLFKRFAFFVVTIGLGFSFAPQARAITKVPPGNRNVQQPAVPFGSIKRTRSSRGTFDRKYEKIRNMLGKNRKLIAKIKKSAAAYGIDPIHIVGALVGEHTYNVDALDRYQTYYVKALAYLNQDLSFRYKKVPVTKFVQFPAFAQCAGIKSSYDLWSCREYIWNSRFRGKRVNGVAYPNDRFGRVFFQPLYAGQTFGLGQLNPLTALKVTDMVARTSRLPRLKASRPQLVYKTIMDPDSTLLYMAAVLKNSIDVYKRYTGFDISANPGITATLYNLGNVKYRAQRLAAKNKKRRAQGKKPLLPEENYYGWLVNNKLTDLKQLF